MNDIFHNSRTIACVQKNVCRRVRTCAPDKYDVAWYAFLRRRPYGVVGILAVLSVFREYA